MTKTIRQIRSWLQFCLAYIDMKWPSAAAKTRNGDSGSRQ